MTKYSCDPPAVTCDHSQMLAPHTSPLFVSAWRLLPAGVALIAWAAATGRRQPSGGTAWLAVALFGLVDGTCFQVGVDASMRRL